MILTKLIRTSSWIVLSHLLGVGGPLLCQVPASPPAPIRFDLQKIPFKLENDETAAKNAPEAMAGGVATTVMGVRIFSSPTAPTLQR
jgi:hypothetical protein